MYETVETSHRVSDGSVSDGKFEFFILSILYIMWSQMQKTDVRDFNSAVCSRDADAVIKAFAIDGRGILALYWLHFGITKGAIKFLLSCGIKFSDIEVTATYNGKYQLVATSIINRDHKLLQFLLTVPNKSEIVDNHLLINTAARYKNQRAFNLLIRAGVQPNDDNLYDAVASRNKMFTRLILELGVTPSAHSLLEAIKRHPWCWVQMLLRAGATVPRKEVYKFFTAAVLSEVPCDRYRKMRFVLAGISLDTRAELNEWLNYCDYTQDITIPPGSYNRETFREVLRAQSCALYRWPLGATAVRNETQYRANHTAMLCIKRRYPAVCKDVRRYIIHICRPFAELL